MELTVVGCPLPVAGCRLAVVGCRLDVVGCRLRGCMDFDQEGLVLGKEKTAIKKREGNLVIILV